MFEITEIGKEMLQYQENIAKEYKYKTQPTSVAEDNFNKYLNNCPKEFINDHKFNIINHQKGYEISGGDIQLISKDGTLIANKYDRVVIGQYGAFIEINDTDIICENIKVKPGQEYRIHDPKYANNVKYQWFTTKDDSNCKLYYQQKGVVYADYKPGKWYISPYEVCNEKEREDLFQEKENNDTNEIDMDI